MLGVVCVSAPYDLELTLKAIENGVYEKYFLILRKKNEIQQHRYIINDIAHFHSTEIILKYVPDINLKDVKKSKRIRDYDENFTLKIFTNYSSVDEFYKSLNLESKIEEIAVPVLNIHAKDDEICTYKSIPIQTCKCFS